MPSFHNRDEPPSTGGSSSQLHFWLRRLTNIDRAFLSHRFFDWCLIDWFLMVFVYQIGSATLIHWSFLFWMSSRKLWNLPMFSCKRQCHNDTNWHKWQDLVRKMIFKRCFNSNWPQSARSFFWPYMHMSPSFLSVFFFFLQRHQPILWINKTWSEHKTVTQPDTVFAMKRRASMSANVPRKPRGRPLTFRQVKLLNDGLKNRGLISWSYPKWYGQRYESLKRAWKELEHDPKC